jgi:hypothetical protein
VRKDDLGATFNCQEFHFEARGRDRLGGRVPGNASP